MPGTLHALPKPPLQKYIPTYWEFQKVGGNYAPTILPQAAAMRDQGTPQVILPTLDPTPAPSLVFCAAPWHGCLRPYMPSNPSL